MKYLWSILRAGSGLAALFLIVAMPGARANGNPGPEVPKRTVDFTYTVRITDVPRSATTIDIWVPIPQTGPGQQVSKVNIEGPGSMQIVTDPKYGNQFAHFEIFNTVETPAISATYRITRSARAELADDTKSPPRPEGIQTQFLSPSRFIALDGSVAEEAKRVAEGATGSLDVAKRLFDHIVDTVKYDKSGTGWGRGDSLYACDAREGNCTDFHSLFIGEARSLGVPARFIMGFPLPNDADTGIIAGYHCWAEFYSPEHGWVPIDASDAFKNPERREQLFGGLDENRVRFTLGRDITLPGMAGDPLNYSIYPYAEVDGTPHDSFETEYKYAKVE